MFNSFNFCILGTKENRDSFMDSGGLKFEGGTIFTIPNSTPNAEMAGDERYSIGLLNSSSEGYNVGTSFNWNDILKASTRNLQYTNTPTVSIHQQLALEQTTTELYDPNPIYQL